MLVSPKRHMLAGLALFSLGGCTPMDLVYDGIVEAQMTPEAVGATPAQYRMHDCTQLAAIAQSFAQQMATASDKRTWRWHIDAVNQVRAEKNCNANTAITASSTGGIIGVRMEPVTPALATTLGLGSTKGALVNEVLKNLPAEKAGIKPMDVILSIAGQNIGSPQELTDIVSRMRVGYKAEIEIWRERTRKTLLVDIASKSQVLAAPAAASAPLASPAAKAPAAGPMFYSYCWCTDVALRKHWTSNVFQAASSSSTEAMAREFHDFLLTRNNLSPDERAFCQIYETQAQAEAEWNKTRKLYRFQTVQNNEIAWSPTR